MASVPFALPIMPPAPRPAPGTAGEPQAGFFAAIGRVLRRPGMASAMYVSITVASTIDVLVAYLPVYGEDRGLPVTLVGLLLSLRAGATMASRLMMDHTLRTLGWQRAMIICLAISALRRCTISRGVAAGANRPNQVISATSMPDSRIVGTLGT